MAASKNRGKKTRSSKPGGKHLSGNPATRAADARQRQMTALLGTVAPEARSWWEASAADVVANAHSLEIADGALALEDAACRLLGEELALRMEHEQRGFDLPEWLKTVTEHAAERFHEVGDGASWLLLRAIVAIGPDHAAKTARAQSEQPKRTPAAAEFAHDYPWAAQTSPARPTGDVLTAGDAYGSRYLLVAPFQIPGDAGTAHWYAWDVDLCDTQRVVAAAVFTEPDGALADWKAAVGTDATANSVLSPATEPAAIRQLLGDCLLPKALGGSVMGDEQIDLLSEYFRMRSRAYQLSRSLPGHTSNPQAAGRRKAEADAHAAEKVLDEFEEWFCERHPGSEFDEDAAATLIIEWLGTGPSFTHFSCSPHRVRTMTSFIWDSYENEVASSICALLPDWVTWCAEKTGLTAALTNRSLAAAHRSTTISRWTSALDQTANPRIVE